MKITYKTVIQVGWSTEQRHETSNFWGHGVKGQGHAAQIA